MRISEFSNRTMWIIKAIFAAMILAVIVFQYYADHHKLKWSPAALEQCSHIDHSTYQGGLKYAACLACCGKGDKVK